MDTTRRLKAILIIILISAIPVCAEQYIQTFWVYYDTTTNYANWYLIGNFEVTGTIKASSFDGLASGCTYFDNVQCNYLTVNNTSYFNGYTVTNGSIYLDGAGGVSDINQPYINARKVGLTDPVATRAYIYFNKDANTDVIGILLNGSSVMEIMESVTYNFKYLWLAKSSSIKEIKFGYDQYMSTFNVADGRWYIPSTFTAYDYRYSQSMERYYSISPAGFIPNDSSENWDITYMYVKSSGVASLEGHIPVCLPSSCTVTSLKAYWYDKDGSASGECDLNRADFTANSDTLATADSSAVESGGYHNVEDTTISNAVISNDRFTYSLFVSINPNDDDTDIYFMGAVIKYSVNKPD